ncbi:MAG: serine--tRNA ligase [Calditrichaeota bacterium]|nr:MAG: serine--tRNA ligase [Calditrichota bacterium]MBL1204533.1 serine--tRNA ligase [Calditrichota bacterium]NOG44361.1 serine--tRNA ligase [Calditrichota bacterium]
MIDIKYLRENPEKVVEGIKNKNENGNIDSILKNDQKRRDLIFEVENLKRQRNENSTLVAQYKREKKDAAELITNTKTISLKIKEIDQQLQELEELIFAEQSKIPNMPHETTPIGRDESFNKTIKEWGNKPQLSFEPKDHIELGEMHDILDFKRGGKISGSGFAVYKGLGAMLERALINFMLDVHIEKHNYTEVLTPFIVNRDSMFGTGQLPKMEDDMYFAEKDDLFLIPTAEVPVTNIHRNETLNEDQLPIKYVAYSACFRREAGSYGKDTRGFQRVHQFNKVEMVNFVHPDNAVQFHEQMLVEATEILEMLKLPYRVLLLCSGDISFAAGKCYDIETWSMADNKWLETSSVSNFDSFQARRSNIRFKPSSGGKTEFIHTLNGSGLATSRLMVSLLEHYQNEDGTITVPEVLHSYMRGIKKIG